MVEPKPIEDQPPSVPEHVDPLEHPFESKPPLEHVPTPEDKRSEQRETEP